MAYLIKTTSICALLALVACGKGKQSFPDAPNPCDVGTTAAELMPCIDKQILQDDIQTIAMERVPGSSHWQSVQDLCKARLESAGYEVRLHNYGTGVNVIGTLAGSNPDSGEVIVSAHYDHIANCPGASDNAAGMAMTLDIARVLAGREYEHTLVIACWDEEESGLIGSRAYAADLKAAGTSVSAMFSFDAIGYFSTEPDSQTLPAGFGAVFPELEAEVVANQNRGDFVALVADESSTALVASLLKHATSLGLSAKSVILPENLKLNSTTADLRRSDHASFWENDYPGVQLTDTANFRNPNYHCLGGQDLPGTLDMDFVTQSAQATLGTAIDALNNSL
jgi:Zn-dependent M28 family amino/carboxypeptidase